VNAVAEAHISSPMASFTRVIAGFHLSLNTPSSTTVALALSHAVLPKRGSKDQPDLSASWPVEGLPQTIHLDNAKEFHVQALERECREYGISLTFRPPQTPHFGGHIERLIGTIMGDLHLLPGTTFGFVKSRGEYKSAANASLTLRDYCPKYVDIIAAIFLHLTCRLP
jgi:putative transposase